MESRALALPHGLGNQRTNVLLPEAVLKRRVHKNDAAAPALIEKLRRLDSCAVANAIELSTCAWPIADLRTRPFNACSRNFLPWWATRRPCAFALDPPMEGHGYQVPAGLAGTTC